MEETKLARTTQQISNRLQQIRRDTKDERIRHSIQRFLRLPRRPLMRRVPPCLVEEKVNIPMKVRFAVHNSRQYLTTQVGQHYCGGEI